MNQTLSYAIVGTLSLVSLVMTLHRIQPFVSDIERRVETDCIYSVLSTISNLVSSVVGGGSVEGIMFTPLQVKLSVINGVISASCGDSRADLEFPFEISPLNTSVKGLVRIKAVWTEEGVSLVIKG
ncbi:MAG: hypothetical protein DRN92_04970 [Thermoproteota archaeon]|nr:MAG: hypothetical protein DRN92_04970 [Candidatus Korarchaeota archaeon]